MITRLHVLGHRGARAHAPENTLPSLRRALLDGADGIEFDVRLTRDGHPVLLHDAALDRTTTGTGLLAQYTISEVRQLDAGVRFSAEFAGEPLPRLEEVLDEFLGRTALAVEMKEPLPQRVLHSIAERLRARPAARLFVASFDREPLECARAHLPAVPRARILRETERLPAPRECTALGLWAIVAHAASVDAALNEAARRAGLALYAYTVNDASRARELAALGVEGIFSDDPGAIVRALRRAEAP